MYRLTTTEKTMIFDEIKKEHPNASAAKKYQLYQAGILLALFRKVKKRPANEIKELENFIQYEMPKFDHDELYSCDKDYTFVLKKSARP